jgi:hypothetical protein
LMRGHFSTVTSKLLYGNLPRVQHLMFEAWWQLTSWYQPSLGIVQSFWKALTS